MKKLNQRGFAIFETAVVIAVIAIVGLAGWNIYRINHKNGSVSTQKVISPVPAAPTISSASDLDKAANALDQTQIDTSLDTAQLDKDLASF